MRLRHTLAALALLLAPAAAQAAAGCAGRNLLDDLPPETVAALDAAVDAAPYGRGNLWRATKDGQTVTLLGTYHLDDPRHEAIVQAVEPALRNAARLLVEAGPEEEKALMALMARDPSSFLAPEGESLRDLMTDDEWAQLSAALAARGTPVFMATRLRPWYVNMLLAVPPCAFDALKARQGLDRRLIEIAAQAQVPVQGLEPYDTALRLFDAMAPEAQVGMIRTTLALDDIAEDQMTTLAAAYFAEDSRVIWELQRIISLSVPGATPEQVDAELALLEDSLMTGRNREWVPIIEEAAAKGPVVVAFGALHLSGANGVLALMAANGWTMERLPFPAP